MGEVIITLILTGFDQKNHFFERSPWLKVNYLRLTLGMALKSSTSVAKLLKLKVRKLIPTFEEVAGKKLLGGVFLLPLPPFRIGLT